VEWVREEARRDGAILVTSQLEESWGPGARYVHCEAGRITEGATDPMTAP
jgi:hypothetical protein